MIRITAAALTALLLCSPAAFAADILIQDDKSQPESLTVAPNGDLIVGQRLHALRLQDQERRDDGRKSSSTPAPKAPAPSSSASWPTATRCGPAS